MSTRKSRIPVILLAGAVLVVLAAVGAGAVVGFWGSVDDKSAPVQRTFEVGGDRLTISRSNGDLDVRPADVDEVEVKRWFSGWSVFGKPKASWDLVGDKLTLGTDCGFVISSCSARYEVLVPKNLALTVEGDNGETTATGFDTALRIRSDNGSVHVSDASGSLTLHSGSGELRATGIDSGRVEARSANGKVYLAFVSTPDRVDVRTENGGVTVEVPDAAYKVTTRTENGDVEANVPTDASSDRTISARTENGAITLRTAG
ncbi:DUF4097 family beta strand repeat-containing protein [Streptomyces sp. NPDC052052]|uniref:DUF4097 family beta strand repeat-containing protein n=1 Tax=Streptomyces sp. NPDC052052 TaxID=3154756 RepID=UPI0034251569